MGANHSQVGPDTGLPRSTAMQGLELRRKNSPSEQPAPRAAAAAQQPEPLTRPVIRRSSSQRGYHPRSASLRRLRSIHRRRILEGSAASKPPARRTAKMEAESKKRQDEAHLLAACARGDLKKVERLVDCGVDVNTADQHQMTALHYASMHARDQVIKSLISRGAEVNTADLKSGFTAMHWVVFNAEPQYAATDRQEKSLSALSRAGCRVNGTDFNFATPLHIAAQKGNKGCVQTLMRLGADPMKVDITGRSCFEVARDDQTKALLRRLNEKYSRSKSQSVIYQVLEPPPPSMPAPPPPLSPPTSIPPPKLIITGKSHSEDHYYSTPEITPPSSPSSLRPDSVTPPPPPPRRRRRQYAQYCNDPHMYHVLEAPPTKSRALSPPRRRKATLRKC